MHRDDLSARVREGGGAGAPSRPPAPWARATASTPTRWPSRPCARRWRRVDIDGTIVIGEGERDEAPMLYIGEKVGKAAACPVDIAVDPLEGTNLCATGAANAIAVLAASEKGGLLHAPDIYMEKLVVGPVLARARSTSTRPSRTT